MTQEEKELLLKDLCARLPYGVVGEFESGKVILTVNSEVGFLVSHGFKPYFRPMLSMTDAEKKEYYYLCYDEHVDVFEHGAWETKIYFHDTIESIDWLNKNYFDYRELLERGLAVEVTKENNPYKN